MGDSLFLEGYSGKLGLANTWRYLLPTDSQVLERFLEPANIVVKRATVAHGQLPKDAGSHVETCAREDSPWGNREPFVNALTRLWPAVLWFISGLSRETTDLAYFSAQATRDCLYSLWSCMPFAHEDDSRFFVSEAIKDSRTRVPACAWVSVEYSYERFKSIVESDGFDFHYGAAVMGISVANSRVPDYLRMPFLRKDSLERGLEDADLRCWWFCEPDFEGMTIWHKDFTGPQLLERLGDAIRAPAEEIGLLLRNAESK